MQGFPRTAVGGVSLSRMIIGTNWFLGYSHTTAAKDQLIVKSMDRTRIADILQVFLSAGVDTMMGRISHPLAQQSIQEAQQRSGRKIIFVSTPAIPVTADTPAKGFNRSEVVRILEEDKRLGAVFCMPHQGTTDALVDRCTRTIRHMDTLCKWIREFGMIPGLSTHMPESIIYADETSLDVETYVSIYNSLGFLMQIEVDWVAQVIQNALKPVMTIKPMASGQLRPFQAFNFVWNTLRECDMVAVGTMSPDEAKECIDLSLEAIERRRSTVTLQETRSKASVRPKMDFVRGVAGKQ